MSYKAIYNPTTFAGLYVQLPDFPRFADATRLINFGGSRVHKGRKASESYSTASCGPSAWSTRMSVQILPSGTALTEFPLRVAAPDANAHLVDISVLDHGVVRA